MTEGHAFNIGRIAVYQKYHMHCLVQTLCDFM